jgi:hypothetical protein
MVWGQVFYSLDKLREMMGMIDYHLTFNLQNTIILKEQRRKYTTGKRNFIDDY